MLIMKMEEYLVMHSTKNRAKSKLLKGAKKPNLDVEVKDGCVNLRFCDGSFHEIILPFLTLWQQRTNEVLKIDEVELKVIEDILFSCVNCKQLKKITQKSKLRSSKPHKKIN